MPTRKKQLDVKTKQTLTVLGALEAGLKIAALIDLVQRPKDGVVGGKWRWAIALATVNSVGLLPVLYFLRGRR